MKSARQDGGAGPCLFDVRPPAPPCIRLLQVQRLARLGRGQLDPLALGQPGDPVERFLPAVQPDAALFWFACLPSYLGLLACRFGWNEERLLSFHSRLALSTPFFVVLLVLLSMA